VIDQKAFARSISFRFYVYMLQGFDNMTPSFARYLARLRVCLFSAVSSSRFVICALFESVYIHQITANDYNLEYAIIFGTR
jgi:hypothetical protein